MVDDLLGNPSGERTSQGDVLNIGRFLPEMVTSACVDDMKSDMADQNLSILSSPKR